MKVKIDKRTVEEFVMVLLSILVFLFPLSKAGIFMTLYDAFAVVALFAIVCVMLFVNGINISSLLIVMGLILYLSISTLVILIEKIEGFYFGYERFLCILTCLLFFNILDKRFCTLVFYYRLLDIIMIFVILFSVLSLFNVANTNDFFVDNYTQYLDYITAYHIGLKKPILFFGVHNVASFIYEGLFILSFSSYAVEKKKRFLAYSIILLLLLFLLRCSTSIVFSVLSIGIMVFYRTDSIVKVVVYVGAVLCAAILAGYFGFLDLYQDILALQSNGLSARYINGFSALYGSNISFIKEHMLGSGFCINGSGTVYGSDSGLLIILTIGGVPFLLAFYIVVTKYIVKNIGGHMKYIVLSYVLIMELGFITFLHYKTLAFLIIVISYMTKLFPSSSNVYEQSMISG